MAVACPATENGVTVKPLSTHKFRMKTWNEYDTTKYLYHVFNVDYIDECYNDELSRVSTPATTLTY